MYIYICIYAYIYVCMYERIYICIYIYIYGSKIASPTSFDRYHHVIDVSLIPCTTIRAQTIRAQFHSKNM